jgi:hypothetical protein
MNGERLGIIGILLKQTDNSGVKSGGFGVVVWWVTGSFADEGDLLS